MQRRTSRYTPDDVFVNECEPNREDVLMPTTRKELQYQYITQYTQAMIQHYGAIEFNTLYELENGDE